MGHNKGGRNKAPPTNSEPSPSNPSSQPYQPNRLRFSFSSGSGLQPFGQSSQLNTSRFLSSSGSGLQPVSQSSQPNTSGFSFGSSSELQPVKTAYGPRSLADALAANKTSRPQNRKIIKRSRFGTESTEVFVSFTGGLFPRLITPAELAPYRERNHCTVAQVSKPLPVGCEWPLLVVGEKRATSLNQLAIVWDQHSSLWDERDRQSFSTLLDAVDPKFGATRVDTHYIARKWHKSQFHVTCQSFVTSYLLAALYGTDSYLASTHFQSYICGKYGAWDFSMASPGPLGKVDRNSSGGVGSQKRPLSVVTVGMDAFVKNEEPPEKQPKLDNTKTRTDRVLCSAKTGGQGTQRPVLDGIAQQTAQNHNDQGQQLKKIREEFEKAHTALEAKIDAKLDALEHRLAPRTEQQIYQTLHEKVHASLKPAIAELTSDFLQKNGDQTAKKMGESFAPIVQQMLTIIVDDRIADLEAKMRTNSEAIVENTRKLINAALFDHKNAELARRKDDVNHLEEELKTSHLTTLPAIEAGGPEGVSREDVDEAVSQ